MFLCGNASNQTDLLELFDMIILLELDEQTMLRRLADPTPTNDFGRGGEARDQLRRWFAGFQQDIRERGAVAVDASASLDSVVSAILKHVEVG